MIADPLRSRESTAATNDPAREGLRGPGAAATADPRGGCSLGIRAGRSRRPPGRVRSRLRDQPAAARLLRLLGLGMAGAGVPRRSARRRARAPGPPARGRAAHARRTSRALALGLSLADVG